MQIVIEPQPMLPQAIIQRSLPCMPKRRMPDIMHQRQRLGQVHIEIQRRRNVPRHLRDLHRMRQPAAKVIRRAAGKHLRLARQPAKRARLHHAIAVTLKRRAVVAGGRWKFADRKPALVFTEDTAGMQIVNHRLSVA